MKDNPLLADSGLPRFDRIEVQDVVPGVREMLRTARGLLEDLESSGTPTWDGLIRPLEEIDRLFEHGWSPVTHLFAVRNSPELRAAYETVLSEVVDFGLSIGQSRPIYDLLTRIRTDNAWSNLDVGRQRIIEQRILAADLAGIGLAGAQRDRFNEVERELSELSTTFSNNVLDATKAFSLIITNPADAAGLPGNLRQLMAQSFNDHREPSQAVASPENGPWRVTLDAPVYTPFMQHCRNRSMREHVYRAYITRASTGECNNTQIISRALRLRREKAELLGFATFACVSLARKMAPDVDSVDEMLETLRSAAWDAAGQEMQDIEAMDLGHEQSGPIEHWDVAFRAERLREQRFDFTDEELRPYFPLERVLDGLFGLAQRLFGITVVAADGAAPVWHGDVRFFHINDESGEHIASFYLDPSSRPDDKRSGAWMDECLGRRHIGKTMQLPVAHLVCNGTPPVVTDLSGSGNSVSRIRSWPATHADNR